MRVQSAVLVVVNVVGLVALRPDPALLANLTAPHGWIARAGVDGAVLQLAGATLWMSLCWLAVGLLAATATRLPGATGRVAHRACALVLPRVLYRVVAGAAGVGVALTPLAAGATVAPPPAWPSAAALPSPHWPVGGARGADRPVRHPTHRVIVRHHASAPPAATVTVAPGDTLWDIAAAHLARPSTGRVAAAWPRWYAVNRAVVGPDPNLITPGQVLRVPTTSPGGGPS